MDFGWKVEKSNKLTIRQTHTEIFIVSKANIGWVFSNCIYASKSQNKECRICCESAIKICIFPTEECLKKADLAKANDNYSSIGRMEVNIFTKYTI